MVFSLSNKILCVGVFRYSSIFAFLKKEERAQKMKNKKNRIPSSYSILKLLYLLYWHIIIIFWSERGESDPRHQLGRLRFYHLTTLAYKKLVGKTGFEPATSWSQTRRSTKLSYFPMYVK